MDSTSKETNHQAGFTLVEALVSVLILSASLVAITSLFTRALQATMIGQQYLIASKLAQEGVEMIRVKRNNNLIAQGDQTNPAYPNIAWDDDLYGDFEMDAAQAFTGSGGENILAHGVALPTAPASLRAIRIYTSGIHRGKYTHEQNGTGFVPGNFTRLIEVDPINTYSASVRVTVQWGSGSEFILSTVLYDAS